MSNSGHGVSKNGSKNLSRARKANLKYQNDIFLYNIPKQCSKVELRNYFSQFGELQSVRIFSNKKRSRCSAPKMGFINFTDTSSAMNALQKKYHLMHGKRLCVKDADRWKEPNAKEACNILTLNDHCLELICCNFTVREQLRFARVCSRFRYVFEIYSKHTHKNFYLEYFNYEQLPVIHDFFRFAGIYVEEMIGHIITENHERIMEFMGTYCKRLKYLCMRQEPIRPVVLKTLLGGLSNINELCLYNCRLQDHSIRALFGLNNVEILYLPNNFELTGKHIKNLHQVKHLSLYGCKGVQSAHMIDIFKFIPGLITLDIRECGSLSESVFEAMAENCSKLEMLKMTCANEPFEGVARLPSLEQLDLWRCPDQSTIERTEVFSHLARYEGNQLKRLKVVSVDSPTAENFHFIAQLKKLKRLSLPFNNAIDDDALLKLCYLEELEELWLKHCPNITNVGILLLLRSCVKLSYINVQGCGNINLKFIPEAIQILKNRQLDFRKPLHFIIDTTLLDDFDVEELNLYEYEYLLKLEFELPMKGGMIDEESDVRLKRRYALM